MWYSSIKLPSSWYFVTTRNNGFIGWSVVIFSVVIMLLWVFFVGVVGSLVVFIIVLQHGLFFNFLYEGFGVLSFRGICGCQSF